jgi:hypothetical protein
MKEQANVFKPVILKAVILKAVIIKDNRNIPQFLFLFFRKCFFS